MANTTWELVGQPTTFRPEFWAGSDLSKLLGQVFGIAIVSEGTASEKPQIRVCEKLADGSGEVVIMPATELDGTQLDGITFELPTTVAPRAGLNRYYVEARLNDAASLTLEGVGLNLFKVA